ncbi:MAG: hsp70 family protein [Lentisphaeria bacterium]|nr:hsp70 family protein [Lentisphaeria bacterium]
MKSVESITPSRFLVGIDLGTTNCSVCYIDMSEPERRLHDFPILQSVASGETAAENLLPSFCYLPGEHDLPENALALPWNRTPSVAVGLFAREQGARIPERLVSSAKSWLAHAGVDRTKPILPWGGELKGQMLSPVDASAHYLEHLKLAWNQHFASMKDDDGTPCLLENQQVVLTVPASFDETARELTVQAARQAGFTKLTLIEEPLAAFYAWLAKNQNDWKQKVSVGDIVLVVDIGGGTTDLTIVEIEDDFVLRRKAVGEHLLLGGDNMDMTLAHIAESAWKTKLPQRQWSRLCQECRRAKEKLLSPDAPETLQVAIAGEGSSIFASLKTFDFKRDDIHTAILDGFFPFIEADSQPPERRQGIQSMGLPYAADPAVTKHILSFLKFAGKTLRNPAPIALPNKILFNGGTLIPSALRQRICDAVGHWNNGIAPVELESSDFSLAVSQGAAYYGLARCGETIRVKGGIANAYFLEIASQTDKRLLCVMPRDTDEGVVCKLPDTFILQANTPVAFPLHASATRLEDKLGDIVENGDDITPLPPLQTILRFGRKTDKTDLKVTLSSQLNEIGTLDVWCETVDKNHRFPLSFVLRGAVQNDSDGMLREDIIDEEHASQAIAYIEASFMQNAHELNTRFMARLEDLLDSLRDEWGAPLLRRIADLLLQRPEWRTFSPVHEARWLNLLGFALRPGTGRIGDGLRIRNAWKLWKPGPLAAKNASVQQNWFIFWRRLAGGLSAGQQEQLAGSLAREILPKDGKPPLKKGDQTALEQWRCIASMERMPVTFKLKCLQAFMNATAKLEDAAFWPVARFVERIPLHGTEDTLIPAAKLEPQIKLLLDYLKTAKQPRLALLALASAITHTGIRTIDLSDSFRKKSLEVLQQHHAPEDWVQALQTDKVANSLMTDLRGDSLPLGLSFS